MVEVFIFQLFLTVIKLLLIHSHPCYFLLVDDTGTNLLLLLVLFFSPKCRHWLAAKGWERKY
jgi:hypothetical protein